MALFRKPRAQDAIEVVGVRRALLGDVYHALIRASWSLSLLIVTVAYALVNLLFAVGYRCTGGIANAHSFLDLFFFSVETSGTIGYGEMHPVTTAAHTVVTLESLVSIVLVALTTGLVFAKFSIPRARMQFASHPVVAPYDGVPTLQFRLGNQRDTRLIEAIVRVVMLRTERTAEGVTMYRMHDLKLVRDRSPAMRRSWTVLHHLDAASPMYGATPESLARDEVEFVMTVIGTDEVSAQAQHAQHQYTHADVRWGVRHADILTELSDGRLRADMTRFNELVPTKATSQFEYGDKV
jgi:inward rectifier potassium channel